MHPWRGVRRQSQDRIAALIGEILAYPGKQALAAITSMTGRQPPAGVSRVNRPHVSNLARAGRLLLATGSEDCTVRIWDPAGKVSIATLRRRSAIESVAICGSMLAIGDQEGVSVIEPDMGVISSPPIAEPSPPE